MPADERFRGYDAEGHRVVVAWGEGEGEYLMALSHCCGATGTCDEDGGLVCRSCYGDVSWALAGEAEVVTQDAEEARHLAIVNGWVGIGPPTDGREV